MRRVVHLTRRPPSWLRTPPAAPATRMLPSAESAHYCYSKRPEVPSRRPARRAADVPLRHRYLALARPDKLTRVERDEFRRKLMFAKRAPLVSALGGCQG